MYISVRHLFLGRLVMLNIFICGVYIVGVRRFISICGVSGKNDEYNKQVKDNNFFVGNSAV